RIEQGGRDLNLDRRRHGRPRRIGRRHGEVERLAEKLGVVDSLVVELVPNSVELAIAPLVGRIRKCERRRRNPRSGLRLTPHDLGRRPHLLHVLHSRGDPDVVAALRAGLGLERLPAGKGEIIRLPGADLQVGGTAIAQLAAVGRVAGPVRGIGLETGRRDARRLTDPGDAGGRGRARGSAERPGDLARPARDRRIHDAPGLEGNPQESHLAGREVCRREPLDERRGGRRIADGVDFDVDLGTGCRPCARPRERLPPGLGESHLRTARRLDHLVGHEGAGLMDHHVERRDDASHGIALDPDDELAGVRAATGRACEEQGGRPRDPWPGPRGPWRIQPGNCAHLALADSKLHSTVRQIARSLKRSCRLAFSAVPGYASQVRRVREEPGWAVAIPLSGEELRCRACPARSVQCKARRPAGTLGGSTMNRTTLLIGMSLTASALAVCAERDAAACGGCFHPPTQTATDITDERMLLAVSTTQSTLYDQIEYAGTPTSFAWVLPIHGTVDVGLSADVLFDSIDAVTATQIQAPAQNCPPPPSDCGQNAAFGAGSAAAPNAGGADGTVTVTKQQNVGPYETVQLHASDSSALNNWLATNGFSIPADVTPIIDEYVTEGF